MMNLKIKSTVRRACWAWIFLGKWFGNTPISQVSPEEVTKALSLLGFSLLSKDTKKDLA